MSSMITKKHGVSSLKQSTRSRRTVVRSRYGSRILRARRIILLKNNNGGKACSSDDVSEKLEALQSLVPKRNDGGVERHRRSEELFEETADYILTLKKQVFVLQRLIELYGSGEISDQNAVAS